MKDGRETGSLEEHRNGEPYALKGARTVRKGPERKGLITVPRSQATLRSSSARAFSNAPRCKYRATTSAAVKARLSQTGQKKFVDHAAGGHADPTLTGWCRMRGDHDPAGLLRRTESQVRTVVEGTADPAFWMLEVLIWRKFQASLDLGPLQDLIVFATHDISQS